MPWDLIFYGSMAIIFIGIIIASNKARREQRAARKAASRPGDNGDSGSDG